MTDCHPIFNTKWKTDNTSPNGLDKRHDFQLMVIKTGQFKKIQAALTTLLRKKSTVSTYKLYMWRPQYIHILLAGMTHHPRDAHFICGSEINHSGTHRPKNGPEPLFAKQGGMCVPRHPQSVQQAQIKQTIEKMSQDFSTKKKPSCFTRKK